MTKPVIFILAGRDVWGLCWSAKEQFHWKEIEEIRVSRKRHENNTIDPGQFQVRGWL